LEVRHRFHVGDSDSCLGKLLMACKPFRGSCGRVKLFSYRKMIAPALS
jgi:hypothetical protein